MVAKAEWLMRGHKSAYGHIGSSDTSTNRRCDPGVSQIDLGRLERRFRLLDGRFGRGHRFLVALHLRLGGP